MNDSNIKKPLLGVFLATGLIMAIYFGGQLIFQVIIMVLEMGQKGIDLSEGLKGFGLEMAKIQVPLLISIMATQFVVMGGGIILLARVWQGENVLAKAGYHKPAPAFIGLGLVALVGIFPLAVLASEWLYRLLPELKFMDASMGELLTVDTTLQTIMVYATIALSPAICEELLFRGFLHRHLQARLKGPWPWIISGSFFALIHYNYFGLPTLLIVGCFLGFLYHYSASIWPGMLVHLCYNGFIVFINNNPEFANLFFNTDGFLKPQILLYSTPALILGIGGILLLARRRLKANPPVLVQ